MMIVEKCMENMELLISSSMVSSEEKPEIIQTTKYTLLAHFWCPLEERNWTKVLLMVICPPLVVSLLRMWFIGHSLPLQADSIFSKQVRDNRANKFGYFRIDLSKFLTVWLTMFCCTLKTLRPWRKENEMKNITNLLNNQLRFCKSLFSCDSFCHWWCGVE